MTADPTPYVYWIDRFSAATAFECGRCRDTGREPVAYGPDDCATEPCQCPAGQAECEAAVGDANAEPGGEIPF